MIRRHVSRDLVLSLLVGIAIGIALLAMVKLTDGPQAQPRPTPTHQGARSFHSLHSLSTTGTLIDQAKAELLLTTKSGQWYSTHLGSPGHWTNAWSLLDQAGAPAPPPPPPPPPAAACSLYVSPAGSDANPGTQAAPWKTVAKVNGASLASGSTVCFEGGQTFSGSDLAAKTGVTYGSYGTGKALLRGPGNTVYVTSGAHDVVLRDLDIAGPYILVLSGGDTYNVTLADSLIHDTPYGGVATQISDRDWALRGNTFRHTGDSAVLVGATRELIDGNVITDAGWNTGVGGAGSHGIYDKGPDTTISNNDISGVPGGQAVSIRFHGARVFGNRIHDTGYAFGFFDYDTAPPPQGTSYVYANRLWNITGWGWYYSGQLDPQGKTPSVSFVVASNTFLFSGAAEATNLSEVPGSASVRVANNIFTGSFGSAYRSCATCSEDHNDWNGGASNLPSGVGDIRTAPMLSPFPLLVPGLGSPVVDAGTSTVPGLSYLASCDGQPLHYCGSAPEMGVVER